MRAPRLRGRRSFLTAAIFALASIVVVVGGGRADEPRAITVFAAASLREPFEALGRMFEAARPGVRVHFGFAGSQELRQQLEEGAPVDVFASADERQMERAAAAQLVGVPRVFTVNQLAVIVPRENPAGVHVFADLPRARRLVIGAPEVPVGSYFLRVLDRVGDRWGGDFKARVLARVVSRELNVRQVLAKVSLGEADAGVVYRTDVAVARDKVQEIAIPDEVAVLAEYPIAVVTSSRRRALAQAFADFVLSPAGQGRLREAGFLAAPKAPRTP